MVFGLLVMGTGALLVAILVGWLVARFLSRRAVLGVAMALGVASAVALALVGRMAFRESMTLLLAGGVGLSAAVGLGVGGLLGTPRVPRAVG